MILPKGVTSNHAIGARSREFRALLCTFDAVCTVNVAHCIERIRITAEAAKKAHK